MTVTEMQTKIDALSKDVAELRALNKPTPTADDLLDARRNAASARVEQMKAELSRRKGEEQAARAELTRHEKEIVAVVLARHKSELQPLYEAAQTKRNVLGQRIESLLKADAEVRLAEQAQYQLNLPPRDAA